MLYRKMCWLSDKSKTMKDRKVYIKDTKKKDENTTKSNRWKNEIGTKHSTQSDVAWNGAA